jgi:hypothetical protein
MSFRRLRAWGICLLVGGILIGLGMPLAAIIMGGSENLVDFSDAEQVALKAKWGAKFELSSKGLAPKRGSHPGGSWIETVPEGVGRSWRPVESVDLLVFVEGVPTPEDLGGVATDYSGNLFVRDSPDCKHWSSWQALAPTAEPRKEGGAFFKGRVSTVSSDRLSYAKHKMHYESLDVPWKSDEEALVKWILEKEPDFFGKQRPFVGWLQFRFEPPSFEMVAVKQIRISTTWSVGGFHAAPKAEGARKDRDGPWRFKAPGM